MALGMDLTGTFDYLLYLRHFSSLKLCINGIKESIGDLTQRYQCLVMGLQRKILTGHLYGLLDRWIDGSIDRHCKFSSSMDGYMDG